MNSQIEFLDVYQYLDDFMSFSEKVESYNNYLNQELSDCDLRISDIMHFVELYIIDESKALSIVKELEQVREHRQLVKNEISRLAYFRTSLGTENQVNRVKKILKQMQSTKEKQYAPRKLNDLFEEATLKHSDNEEQKQRAEEARNRISEIDNEISGIMEFLEQNKVGISKSYWFCKKLKSLLKEKNEKQREIPERQAQIIILKNKRNSDYLAMLDKSIAEAKAGGFTV